MINGSYSDGKTSKTLDAFLYTTDSGRIGIKDSHKEAIIFNAVKISPRIGNTTRYIEFPDGAVFETEDNDAIDEIIKQLSVNRQHNFVHRLESSKRLVVVTLLTVILVGWGFIQFGIPHFSRAAAMLLTDEQTKYLGSGVLKTMDKHILESSELDPQMQDELRSIFQSILNTLQKDNIRLVFRKSESIGANAFALPDGTILFTDDLILLADDKNEIISIMLHEIGHLQHRHSLRMAIQGFSLAIFITAITGDVSASSSIVTSLPAVLIESGYSREMETEADTYSLLYMLGHKINPIHFSTIMKKLEAIHTHTYKTCLKDGKSIRDCLGESMQSNEHKETDSELAGGYFSSHPGTGERIQRFEKAAANIN
jgi:Zn-dependent protease with chaperone function